jgi:hypothetical protein
MSKGPDDGLRIGAAAGYGPRVPYLTPGARVDLGPAGSLIQARGWPRTARISGRPAAQRDWRLHAAAAVTAAAVALLALGVGMLSAAVATGQLVGWLLGLLVVPAGGLGGIAAVGAVQARYRQGPVEAQLSTQIRREQHSARELDLLRPLGWTVLHDRLAPGTEHRLAHVLAGPGGLVVATVLPVADPLRRYGQQLYTGQVPLQEWFTTRWWEAWTLQAAVTARLAHWPWRGLAYPIALLPDDAVPPAGQVPPGMLRYPRAQDGVRIRGSGTVRSFVQALPASLGRLAAPSSAPRSRRPAHPPQCRDSVLDGG